MLKNIAILEVEKNGKKYEFHLPQGCTLGEAHDVIFEMRTFIVERIQEAFKADAPKQPEVPKEEQPKEVTSGQ